MTTASLRLRAVRGEPSGHEPEAEASDRGHDVRLLVDQPANDLGLAHRIVGQVRGPAREIPEDGVRLDQRATVRELEHRRRAKWIQPLELVGERVAVKDVDRDALVLEAELSEQQANLEAVRRSRVVVELGQA